MEKKPLNIEIGKRIREERERAGLTREQLAEYTELTPRFIADIERGSVGISISTLMKFCEILKVSSDRLLWGTRSDVGIDEHLKFINKAYIGVIDKTVRCQLELIELVRSEESTK